MKFTINKERFLRALTNNEKIISSKLVNPILNNLKLDLFEDRLEIISSNGEISIKTIINKYEGELNLIRDLVPGSILVSAKMLTEIIKRIDSEEIVFTIEDNSTAKIITSRSLYNLNVIRSEEYTNINFEKDGIEINIDRKEFENAINQTSFAASTKDTRPILQCVNLESDTSRLIFTATDGARLGRRIVEAKTDSRFMVNINSKSFNEVIRSLTDEDNIKIYVSETKALFELKDSVIITTISKGDYPNTHNIVPTQFPYTLEVNTSEFLKCLERCVLFSVDRQNIVKLTCNSEEVEISSKSTQVGDAKENLSTFAFNGERLQISFNVDFVGTAIRALKSDSVVLSFTGEMKPFTVTTKSDDKVVQLITPVRTY